jgi:hypothetical protein
MKFLLSDLQRAKFPDPIVKGRRICFPGFEGRVSKCDGRFFQIKRKLGIDLKYWIMFDGELIPVDQVQVTLEPGSEGVQSINDRAVERFLSTGNLTVEGLKAALSGPDEEIPPAVLNPPDGDDDCRAYFARHEPYVHVMLNNQPDVLWRAYFRGAVPATFTGFEQDYASSVLSKMVSYHKPVALADQDVFVRYLQSQIKPPALPYMWMADYARRNGFSDAQNVSDGAPVASGLLSLPATQGPIEPRYSSDIMSRLMASPQRQLTALVLFALTDGTSSVWPKPRGFDPWLFSTFSAP